MALRRHTWFFEISLGDIDFENVFDDQTTVFKMADENTAGGWKTTLTSWNMIRILLKKLSIFVDELVHILFASLKNV